jgi:hypothetical protein
MNEKNKNNNHSSNNKFMDRMAERLGAITDPREGNGGKNKNNNNKGVAGEKRVIKPPSEEVWTRYVIEHPGETPEDVAEHFDFLMWERRWFPQRYKTWALADEDEYYDDCWTEIKESALNNHDKVWLANQLERRKRIAAEVVFLEERNEKGGLQCEVYDTTEYDTEKDVEILSKPFTQEEYLQRIKEADEEEDDRIKRLWYVYNPVIEEVKKEGTHIN